MNNILSRHFMYPSLKDTGHIFYQGYINEIKRIVPKDRSLIFNVKEGWTPLCKFLDLPIPDEPFHHINDRPVIVRNIGFLVSMERAATHKRMIGVAAAVITLAAACTTMLHVKPLSFW